MMTRHRRLKAMRAMFGKSQYEVAKILEISENSYRAKENGQREFTILEIQKILGYFGKSFEEIFF